MSRTRCAGVLLHPTSLPGPGPGGTLGEDAHRFVDFMADAGLRVWQMLPLGRPDQHRSPYQCTSTRAGNPALIDKSALVQSGWLEDSHEAHWLDAARRRFDQAAEPADRRALEAFRDTQKDWLDDYSLYTCVKTASAGTPWWAWPEGLRDRDPEALRRAAQAHDADRERCVFEQFLFDRQWRELRDYARRRGIELFGDMPIFPPEDSADVWAERRWFKFDEDGRAKVVSGVPPDAFSVTGQHWGGVHYNWETLAADGFDWWVRRTRFELERADLVRIDHFRGFVAAWEIPAGAQSAETGEWVAGPGAALFDALKTQLGSLNLVAEDLGVITPAVHALCDRYDLPGMHVLQFAFDGGADNPHLPHKHRSNAVVYTGTHDNNTVRGWAKSLPANRRRYACDYLGVDADDLPAALERTAFASVADLAILPMQDFLMQGAAARMNTPGRATGNWRWRFDWSQAPAGLAEDIGRLVSLYGRHRSQALSSRGSG